MPIESYGEQGALTSRFVLKVDDVDIGWFSSVSGLSVQVEVTTHNEGGQNGFAHKFPGQMTWPDITLKRGLVNSNALFEWLDETSGEGFAAAGNKIVRRTASVTMTGTDGTELRSWKIEGAFPVRWTGPNLDANQNSEPQEELVIAHHGFTTER